MSQTGKARFDGDVPTEPHLVFYTGVGTAQAFKRGTVIGIVMDSRIRSPHHKMAITKVSEGSLHFKCICNPTCTVKWVYSGKATGQHSK